MGTQGDDAGSGARSRAGTLTVIGIMAAIAVVSVTAVVAWARLGQPGGSEAAVAVEEIPTALADGNQPHPVPDAVVSSVDRPVVGTARLEQLPEHMLTSCTEHHNIAWDPGGPTTDYAFITTDGVVASLSGGGELVGDMDMGPEGQQATGMRLTCELELEDGSAINRGGGSFEHIFPDAPQGGGFTSGSWCCDDKGLTTASASIAVPPEANWLLQDRGTWFQAYDVDGLDQVGLSWKYRERRMGPGGPPMSSVVFTDDDGAVVGEATAGGQF